MNFLKCSFVVSIACIFTTSMQTKQSKFLSFENLQASDHQHLAEMLSLSPVSLAEILAILEYKEQKWVPAFRTQYDVIPELIKQHNLKRGCEVGVLFGTQSVHILETSNIPELYCIDPFQTYKSIPPSANVNRLTQDEFDIMCYLVEERLRVFESRATLIREASPAAAARFPDHHFDFVYIDGDHSEEAVYKDLIAWFAKIRPGGFLIGDDYCEGWYSVRQAVDRFVEEHHLTMQQISRRMYIICKPLEVSNV